MQEAFACIMVTALASALASATPLSTLTFDNQSGEPTLIKLQGPTPAAVTVRAGAKQVVKVAAGIYSIKVRYGTPPRFRFSLRTQFQVEDSPGYGYENIVTLNKPPHADPGIRSITAAEFDSNALVPEPRLPTVAMKEARADTAAELPVDPVQKQPTGGTGNPAHSNPGDCSDSPSKPADPFEEQGPILVTSGTERPTPQQLDAARNLGLAFFVWRDPADTIQVHTSAFSSSATVPVRFIKLGNMAISETNLGYSIACRDNKTGKHSLIHAWLLSPENEADKEEGVLSGAIFSPGMNSKFTGPGIAEFYVCKPREQKTGPEATVYLSNRLKVSIDWDAPTQ